MSPNPPNRILVVDDEDRLRLACRRVLEAQGFEVFEAENGLAGLEAISRDRPDLVLVDLMMPKMGGMELLAAAREKHPDLAFVVITGFATLEKAVEAMKQGADDFLAKPFKPQELRMVVERVIKRVATLADMAVEKSRNRTLVDSMSNGVLVLNLSGNVARMNQALKRMVGFTGQSARGLTPAEVLPCPEVVDILEDIIAGKGGIGQQSCQVHVERPGGGLHLQVECLPFKDGRGNLVGAMAVFDDVTAWRRLDDLKNEYVSTVAHDIASPLGSVLAQLQTLLNGLAGDLNEKQEHLVNRAALRVQGIVDLSRDLLDLARLESKEPCEAERVDLAALIKDAAEVVGSQAEKKEQDLILTVPESLPVVSGMPLALSQVFVNLLSNAVRYTPYGGRVEIGAEPRDQGVAVWVKDNGFGIPAEDHQRIFERFYRVKDANTRSIVGTGLGLPIVKKVAEDLGGGVELESEPGKGSIFTVWLPAAD